MLTSLFVSARPLPSLTTISSLTPNQNPPHTAKAPNFNQFKENPKLPDAAIKVPTAPWMKGPLFLQPDELINTSHHRKSTRKQNAEEKTFKALNRRESGVRGSKAMKKIVRSVEKLEDSEETRVDYGGEFESLGGVVEEDEKRRRRMPWEREEEKFILRRRKKERVLTTADLILDEGLLKRLRLEGSKMREWVNVRKAGVTETVVKDIRLIWEGNELAMVRFDVPLCRNMERAQEILELKTGGLVVLSKKEFLVVYRGPPTSDSSVCVKEGGDEISSSLYVREGERLLNGLGPRYMDWWMRRPFPVDADLLPEVVDGYRTPSRRCPPNTRAKLSDEELTYLRNVAQALPFHFVLGRNHGLQGLASAILKLWERCVIAKIAIKWGALNTNNEEMADELKHLTGGVLILRNKYLIILFRGKDFLSDEVADLVDDRERLLRRYQHFEETKRESDIEISEVVTDGEELEETSKTGTLLEFQELQRKFGEMEVRNLETEAEKAKLDKELKSQEHKLFILKSKIEKTATELLRLNSLRKPSERDDDIEILTDEERECLRKIGLKMNSSLVLGRRGVFDGVMEGLHQHWKHREVAKVITMQKLFSRVVYTAKSLEAESNGVLISIEKLKEGHAILMYRGRNYKRPSSKLMAQNLLTKRKALQRSVLMQRLGSLKFFAYQRERITRLMDPKARTVICIGDIHGHISKIDKLWVNLQSALIPSDFSSALVIFLGDYCDRGPETRKVIDFLISLPGKHPYQTHVFLAGNHDFAFAGFMGLLPRPLDGSEFKDTWKEFEESEEREGWYKGGGFEDMHVQGRRWAGKTRDQFDFAGVEFIGSVYDAGSTFESYNVPHGSSDLMKAVPESHKKFLTNMAWVHEEEDVCIETEEGLKQCKLIALHAGLDKRKSVNDQLKLLRAKDTSISKLQQLNGRKDVWNMPQELDDKQTVVVSGHHGKLHVDGLRLIIDESGGYADKPLAAIVLPSKKIIRDTDIFSN